MNDETVIRALAAYRSVVEGSSRWTFSTENCMRAALEAVWPNRELATMIETLEECYEYFKAREDCDCDGDPLEYRPNPEMNMARKCAEALGYE